MKKIFVFLFALWALSTTYSCRTVKKQKSETVSSRDSSGANFWLNHSWQWNTLHFDTPVIANAGALKFAFDGTDSIPKRISTPNYDVTVKGGKNGSVEVEGKNFPVPAGYSKTEAKGGTESGSAAAQVSEHTEVKNSAKETSSVTVWLAAMLMIAAAIALLYFLDKKILRRG